MEGLVRWRLKVYLALHYPDAALGHGVVVATSRDPDLLLLVCPNCLPPTAFPYRGTIDVSRVQESASSCLHSNDAIQESKYETVHKDDTVDEANKLRGISRATAIL